MKKNQNPKSQKISNNQLDVPSNDQVAELTADLQRLQAEFINYKSRVESEKAMLSQFAKVNVVKELLPVIDDLERALAHLPEDLTDNKWAQGAQKVYTRLQSQLQKMGVSVILAIDQPFNPELHEAVSAEGDGDHQVVSEILQNGYMLGDTVIRHAVVKVTNK
ncbi:nucleotide exchange factor GrpE [Candidatus Nomurabacteria bacterium]|nr:nucleotide exchange factor GrpE [Candidatus Nomurabacteria bacterium]